MSCSDVFLTLLHIARGPDDGVVKALLARKTSLRSMKHPYHIFAGLNISSYPFGRSNIHSTYLALTINGGPCSVAQELVDKRIGVLTVGKTE